MWQLKSYMGYGAENPDNVRGAVDASDVSWGLIAAVIPLLPRHAATVVATRLTTTRREVRLKREAISLTNRPTQLPVASWQLVDSRARRIIPLSEQRVGRNISAARVVIINVGRSTDAPRNAAADRMSVV